MSHKLSCLKFSLLTEETATFLSVPFGVVAVGFKESYHRFLHLFLAYIAERWYLSQKWDCEEKVLTLACVMNIGRTNISQKPGTSSSIKLEHYFNQNGKKIIKGCYW